MIYLGMPGTAGLLCWSDQSVGPHLPLRNKQMCAFVNVRCCQLADCSAA
jgi:hypothetical protein